MPSRLLKWSAIAFLVLLLNTAYIAAFASATVFYMGNILIAKNQQFRKSTAPALWLFLLAFVTAAYLVAAGNIREHRWAWWAHIATAAIGVAALIPYAWKQPRFRPAFQVALAILVLFPLSISLYRRLSPNPNDRIRNPHTVPASMDGEGADPTLRSSLLRRKPM